MILSRLVGGFSIIRKDACWILKVQDSATEGSFGSLQAAMSAAYWLAYDEQKANWKGDRAPAAVWDPDVQYSG
nr:hypothetical protein 1 [bacterium]